jgi:hypothetical protein
MWLAWAVRQLALELGRKAPPQRVLEGFFFEFPRIHGVNWFHFVGRVDDVSTVAVDTEFLIPVFGSRIDPTQRTVPDSRVLVVSELRFFAQKAVGDPVTEVNDYGDRELLGFLSFIVRLAGRDPVTNRFTADHTDATTEEAGRFSILNRPYGPANLKFLLYAQERTAIEVVGFVDKAFPSPAMTPTFAGAEVAGFSFEKNVLERLLGEV